MHHKTLGAMLRTTVETHPSATAYQWFAGNERPLLTYQQVWDRTTSIAKGLLHMGLQKGDRIAVISDNRVEWSLLDLAMQRIGLVNVSIYPSLPAPQAAFIVRDSQAALLVIADKKQAAKLPEITAQAPAAQHILTFDNIDGYTTLEQLEQNSASLPAQPLTNAENSVLPNDIATFIYTSGTTGEPKGAMLTHSNILQTPDAVPEEPIAQLGPGDIFLSWLPISHITERVAGHYLPLRTGACTVFSKSLQSLSEELTTTVRPTCMLAVPRLWETIYQRVMDGIAKLPPRKRKIAQWAVHIGQEAAKRRSDQKAVGPLLTLQLLLAKKLVLNNLRDKTTGGRLRLCVSGGAPLPTNVATLFLGVGINILEGYGLSETNIITVNRPGKQRIGTVGTLLPNVELKIAEDGEILMRGQGRMLGYHNRPHETQEAIDPEGWFHTGDIGEISSDGYLKITDRKKDLLVLSNGKKVAPQPLEARFKESPFIEELVLFGDKQPTVCALVVPAFGKLRQWAEENNLAQHDLAELTQTPEVKALLKKEIDTRSEGLADYERIKKFAVLPKPFSIEGGELTPTLKVRRRAVAEKYAEPLAAIMR
jgi:long-chain acyl-CoA synthetase